MGRRERPIDRTAGPVAAFADDLRRLRAEAGSPAYAALAKRTGYGTSTLADAAGGRRLPTLEVTLAYVSACGGDEVAWEHRWRAVTETLSTPVGTNVRAGQGAPDNAGQSPDVRPRRRALGAAVAAAGLAAAGAVGFLAADREGEPAPAPAAATRTGGPAGTSAGTSAGTDCPPASGGLFGGTTFAGGVQVRTGAGVSFPVQRRLPGDCAVRFTGWCVGETVVDVFEGYPDARWYVLPDGSLLASAVVLGVPPAGSPPVECAGARPPARVLRVTAAGRAVTAAVADGGTVGFAARYRRAGDSAAGWHQVGVDENPRDGSRAALPAEAAGAPLVAVGCYGPSWPASAAATAGPVPAADLDRARQLACRPWH